MKRIILFSYFLVASFFCFAQQNLPAKIIGNIPSANSNKKYKIQVGVYEFEKNTQAAILSLRRFDLSPATEKYSELYRGKYRELTRVMVKDVPASQVRSVLSSIAKAGFREVIIREDSSLMDAPANASSARQESNYNPSAQVSNYNPSSQESYYTPPAQAGGSGRTDALCKTWKIENCPNLELVGSMFFILDDGTYYVTNANGESSSLSEWRRGDGNEFEYSHNGWEYYGRAEIIKLTDDSFEIKDSGYSYDNPGNSSAGYSNLWTFSRVIDEPYAEKPSEK